MRIIHSLLWGFIITWFSLPAFAELQITLLPGESGAKIMVSNDVIVSDVDVYLIHFDMDAEADQQFLSWQLSSDEWKSGLKSVSSKPLNLPVLESYSIEFDNKPCPENHRCFLAAVAASPNHTTTEFWQASSFLPLTPEAACERFQGQQLFASCDSNFYAPVFTSVGDTVGTGSGITESLPSSEVAASGSSPETEKPDIFKLVDNNKLLFANSQAKRFQIIDVADFENPRMSGWTALAANPREIYALNGHYVLLQNDYRAENGTSLTVFKEDEFGNPNSVYSMALPGHFIESRRRREFIYTVTDHYDATKIYDCVGDCYGVTSSTIKISALRLDTTTGKLQEVDKAELAGYAPIVAIFPNHLVIANRNPQENNWQSTQIQLFDLAQADDPLLALPTINVPGQVPSEFHLSVYNQQFRVVYGPEDREDGSTLAVYDLTAPQMPLLGKVDKIAPGEGLFATRFVDNRAFVVTFERTDPLWVIDLSEPTQPTIVGELHIPGWSEKMFFHEDRLFAVGIDDQPTENEGQSWVRRVAVSLFNVADPTEPKLINRFTPLAGEARYSWSPALDDERALLLNWTDSFAALPINSWETGNLNHLQIVSFGNDRIEDAGRLDSSVQIQRSLSLAPEVLAALGDQALMTLSWGNAEPKVLGELELAINLSWLQLQDDKLWAAAYSNGGLNRFYRYTLSDLKTPAERWQLPKGYGGLIKDDNLAVFYDLYPLTMQVFDVETSELRPTQPLEKTEEELLEKTEEEPNSLIATKPFPYGRSQPLVHNGWFYVAEQQPFQGFNTSTTNDQELTLIPEDGYGQPQWLLRSWDLATANETPAKQIPGYLLAFTANDELITWERTRDRQTRLNLLALKENSARLLQSRVVTCKGNLQLIWANEAVYVSCQTGDISGLLPAEIVLSAEKINAVESRVHEVENSNVEILPPTMQILKLNPAQGFTEEDSWTLPGYQNLRAISGKIALVASDGYRYNSVLDKDMLGIPAFNNGCNVYKLLPGQKAEFVSNLLECPYYSGNNWALSANKAWIAKGFEGISVFEW